MSALDRVERALSAAGSLTRDGKLWTCPAHDDHDPSLSVGQGELGAVLHCHAGCETDDVIVTLGLVRRDLFDDAAPNREPRPGSTPPVRVLGSPTEAQVRALARSRRVQRAETLAVLGVVRVRCYGRDWLGIPALGGSWKLWGVGSGGQPRLKDGKLERRNSGQVSIVASPTLCAEPRTAPVERLYDVEGESDLLACVEAGIGCVVTGTGGANSLVGHEHQRAWLLALRPREVCVVRDLDDAGRAGAERSAAWWRANGVPTRVVELPLELGPRGDVRDYLNGRAAQLGGSEFVALGDGLSLDNLANSFELREPDGEGLGTNGQARSAPVHVVPLDTVRPENVSWLWAGRIPLGKLTIIDGDPGLGKSTVTIDLAARCSTGAAMPDGSPVELGAVIILSAEDGLADTIQPRLRAAAADLSRVFALRSVPDDKGEPRSFVFPDDIEFLRREIESRGATLVIVDPLMAFLAQKTNSHNDQHVRGALAPLARMAEDLGCAVVVVRHLNKMVGGHPLYRGGGSIGILGAARSALLVGVDPDDPESRVVAATKSNLGPLAPSLRFRIVAQDGASAIEWGGLSPHAAHELLAAPGDTEEQSAIAEAVAFLRDALACGPMAANEIKRDAKSAGISTKTLERAKRRLRIPSRKQGMRGGFRWELPETDSPPKDANSNEERQPQDPGDLRDGWPSSTYDEREVLDL